jgi:hypothetical protein
MISDLKTSWDELWRQFVFSRLFVEDDAVEGTCWFAKRREDEGLHVFANCLRIVLVLAFAPIYILTPRALVVGLANFFKSSWAIEQVGTPDAVLSKAPGDGGPAKYEVSHLRPSWMLEVTIANGKHVYRQVPWDNMVRGETFTALSYPFSSAQELFVEAGNTLPSHPEPYSPASADATPHFSKLHRQMIAGALLSVYIANRATSGKSVTEYVWLDEFCLSEEGASEPDAMIQRELELGRIADIFRQAALVCVFCHVPKCDHTGQSCPWGSRIFTLGEILHANRVLIMTRTMEDKQAKYHLYPEPGRNFRERLQAQAGLSKSWHLYAIMQHASNSGTVPWQVAIHALLVETIRRDLIGGFDAHEYLGKALNGLLPRRAQLADLPGKDGWADLAWLLELNQGFYNTASLAAVCSLSEGNAHGQCWLGPPILPSEGNERLEPLVTAFPIPSGLNIINPKILGLRQTLKRDKAGLHHNRAMIGLKA